MSAECDPTSTRSVLERLTKWRDTGDDQGDYTAGNRAFANDVISLLSLLEWRPISEAPKDGTRMLFSDAQGNVGICWWEPANEGACKLAGWISDACIDFGGFEHPAHFLPLPAAPTEAKRDAQRTEDDDALSAVAMRDLEEAAACDPWPIPAETHAAIAAIHASMAPPKTAPVVGAAAKDEEAEGLRPLTPDEIESGSYLLSRAKDDGIDMALLGRLCREEPDEAAKREVAETMAGIPESPLSHPRYPALVKMARESSKDGD